MGPGSGNDLAEDYETPDFSSRASLDISPIFLLTIIFPNSVATAGYLSLSGETGVDRFPPGRIRRHCAKAAIPAQAGIHRCSRVCRPPGTSSGVPWLKFLPAASARTQPSLRDVRPHVRPAFLTSSARPSAHRDLPADRYRGGAPAPGAAAPRHAPVPGSERALVRFPTRPLRTDRAVDG